MRDVQVTSTLHVGKRRVLAWPSALLDVRTCSSISGQRPAATSAAKYFEVAHGHVRVMADAAAQGLSPAEGEAVALRCSAPLPCSSPAMLLAPSSHAPSHPPTHPLSHPLSSHPGPPGRAPRSLENEGSSSFPRLISETAWISPGTR